MGFLAFDQFSLLHFATGVISYFWGFSFVVALLIHTVFEIFENNKTISKLINDYIRAWPGGKPHQDTFANSLGDTLVFGIGWIISYYLDSYGNKNGWYGMSFYMRRYKLSG